MNMFLTSISKLINSLYVFATFQLKIGCFSCGQLDLGATCTGLLVLAVPSAFLTARIAAFTALITALVMTCVMLCSVAIFIICTHL